MRTTLTEVLAWQQIMRRSEQLKTRERTTSTADNRKEMTPALAARSVVKNKGTHM
jgi:hypothetical protein